MNKKVILGLVCVWLLVVAFIVLLGKINPVNRMVKAGVALYDSEKYDMASAVFYKVTEVCSGITCSVSRYNLGNTLYYRGETVINEEKIGLWRQSIDAYDSALEYEKRKRYIERINHNKQVVVDNLKEMGEDTEEEENQEGEEQGDSGGEESENSEEDGNSQDSEGEKEGEEEESGEGGSPSELSDSQREQLEQYQELLEQQQQQNQEFFAPIPSSMQDESQSLIDQFFGGNTLQGELPKGGGVDW